MAEETARGWSFGDGRFTYTAPLASAPTIGTPVLVAAPDGRRFLGQVGRTVLADAPGASGASDLQVLGEGSLVALLDQSDVRPDEPFVNAPVATAPESVFDAWVDARLGRTARLDLGPARPAGLGTVRLAADGFTRHTFLCGQSGSGKTYTLGLLLEQLLLHTDLKIIVLDPNSDYVRITEMNLEGLDGDARHRGEALPNVMRVFRSRGPNPRCSGVKEAVAVSRAAATTSSGVASAGAAAAPSASRVLWASCPAKRTSRLSGKCRKNVALDRPARAAICPAAWPG